MEKAMNKKNMDNLINRLRQAIAGVQKHFANDPTIDLDGKLTKPADVIATFTGAVNAIDAELAADTVFHDAVAAQRVAVAAAKIVLADLRTLCVTKFGKKGTALGDFGFEPRTRRKPDAATVERAVKKREATRAARGTKGPRAKLAIKGEIPATPAPTPAKA
jgi:hypothetical protein